MLYLFVFPEKHDSGNLYFCFRWLLICFKREFSFPDIMTLWEVRPRPTGAKQEYELFIPHFWSGKGTGAEMRPAVVSGIVTGGASVSYWPIFSLFLVTVPEVFAKVNSAQFRSCF